MYRYIMLSGLLCLPLYHSICQSNEIHEHTGHTDSHHSGGFEVGFSVEYTYLDEDEDEPHHEEGEHESHSGSESTAGLHLHLIRRFSGEGLQKYFGVGMGGEVIFTDDPHYSLMGSLAVYPWRDLTLLISPGVEFAKHEESYESQFAMHYEASYSFDAGDFHVGPVIGFSHTEDSRHYSIGIHVGF